jgi:sulfur transfer protein SufE
MNPDKFTLVQVINTCSSLGALEDSRLVHEELIPSGCKSDVFVVNSLVGMFAKCCSIEDA